MSESYSDFSIAIAHIHSNFSKKITIDELAELCKMSKGHFMRKFHEELGITPIQYLNNFRIYRSIKLIKESQLNISEIGYRCGFNNISYFIRKFKEQVGMTPKKYRQHL